MKVGTSEWQHCNGKEEPKYNTYENSQLESHANCKWLQKPIVQARLVVNAFTFIKSAFV